MLLGVPFVGHKVKVEPGPNVEARARHARFGVLPKSVATGHTADDVAETKNLATEQPDKLQEMRKRLDSIIKDAVPAGGTTEAVQTKATNRKKKKA